MYKSDGRSIQADEVDLSRLPRRKASNETEDDEREWGKAAQRYASIDMDGNSTEEFDDLQMIDDRISDAVGFKSNLKSKRVSSSAIKPSVRKSFKNNQH